MSNSEIMEDHLGKLEKNNMELIKILQVILELPENKNPEILKVTPTKEQQTHRGLYNVVTVWGEPNLVSENIKEGTSIFGVEGSAKTADVVFTNGANLFSNNQRTIDLYNQVDEFAKLCDWKQFTSCEYMFANNTNLTKLIIKNASQNNITTTYCMFNMCQNLTELDISDFNTSNVTNMGNMFYYCINLTELDVSNFDTSKVTNMNNMFYNCRKITELDASNFDTSNVTDMHNMFNGCQNLTELDVSNFDTGNVTKMSNMFYNCQNLTKLDLSNFNTSNVTTMYNMFNGCQNLTELDVSNFDTNNVTNMADMFYNCINLTELDVSSFDTSKVTDMEYIFYGCSKLTSLDFSNFDMSNVKNINNMISISNITNIKFGINLGKGYTEKTTNYSKYKLSLSSCSKLTHESLMSVINNLYDLNLAYDVANGGTLYRQGLVLGSTNKAKLTAEEIAIATNKGWNVT